MLFSKRLSLLLLAAIPVACSAPASQPTGSLDDALTAQDFDATVRYLGALPWLPWTYLTDGCYARALYYSMLLATKHVPTNHLYVMIKPGAPPLFGIWAWHVAPMVTKDGDPNHLYVLDPAYDQTRALTNVEWVAKQNYADPTAANYPNLYVDPGNSYLASTGTALVHPETPVAADYKEPTFDTLPTFTMASIGAACSTMHRYIDFESTTEDVKADKHSSLGRETARIVAALDSEGKLDGPPTLSPSCTRTGGAGGPADGGSGGTFVDPTRVLP